MNTQPMLIVIPGSRNLPGLEQDVFPHLPIQIMERNPPSRLRRSPGSSQRASRVPEYVKTKCTGCKRSPLPSSPPVLRQHFADSVTGIGTGPRLLLRRTCKLTVSESQNAPGKEVSPINRIKVKASHHVRNTFRSHVLRASQGRNLRPLSRE